MFQSMLTMQATQATQPEPSQFLDEVSERTNTRHLLSVANFVHSYMQNGFLVKTQRERKVVAAQLSQEASQSELLMLVSGAFPGEDGTVDFADREQAQPAADQAAEAELADDADADADDVSAADEDEGQLCVHLH